MIDKEIIKIASNTENHGVLDNHTHFSKLKNSICGDEMKVYLIVVNENDIHNIVVGIPLNMKGEDSKQTIIVREFVKELKLQIELEKAKKPGYWELFAEFYYTDDNVPLYCRKYAKPKSLFKKPGDVCLSPDGKWEVIN